LPPDTQFAGINITFDNRNGVMNDLILEIPFTAFHNNIFATRDIQLSAIRNPPGTSINIASITTAGLVLAGDYDRTGVVNEDDYLVWRDYVGLAINNGSTKTIASPDGDGDGIVNAADYTIWRDRLGAQKMCGLSAAAQIPEPPAALLVSIAALLLFSVRKQSPIEQ
jgi:hypothetical protein